MNKDTTSDEWGCFNIIQLVCHKMHLYLSILRAGAAIEAADAVMFHIRKLKSPSALPSQRGKEGQIWVWFTDESPFNTFLHKGNTHASFNGIFNWTMSYRQSSVLRHHVCDTPSSKSMHVQVGHWCTCSLWSGCPGQEYHRLQGSHWKSEEQNSPVGKHAYPLRRQVRFGARPVNDKTHSSMKMWFNIFVYILCINAYNHFRLESLTVQGRNSLEDKLLLLSHFPPCLKDKSSLPCFHCILGATRLDLVLTLGAKKCDFAILHLLGGYFGTVHVTFTYKNMDR